MLSHDLGSPDPASGEWGTRSRGRGRSPSQPHTADIPNSPGSTILHLCLEAKSGCFGAVDFTRWMPSLCWNNKHFVKAALCSATKAGTVHWIPELVRVFDVATLGLALPQGICASLWQPPGQGNTVTKQGLAVGMLTSLGLFLLLILHLCYIQVNCRFPNTEPTDV